MGGARLDFALVAIEDLPVVASRTCTRCSAEKPLPEFDRDARATLGVKSCCKACSRADERARFARLRAQSTPA
jgi:hypothetical protein